LVECWYDNFYQGYVNVAPKISYCKDEKERFEFRILEYNQIVNALNELKEIISTTNVGIPKFIFIVSPVPLLATFRRQDVIVVNFYSKSLLRSCVEQVVIEDKNAYYFPSYEMVVQSNSDIWTNDLRHIKPHIVVRIVNCFVVGTLHKEDFPDTVFNSCVLYALTQLLSKTEDFSTNKKRELYIGSYNLYPDQLSEEMLVVLQNQIQQADHQNIQKSKAYLFASLIIAIQDKNIPRANKYYLQLVSDYQFDTEFEISILAGLLLNNPDQVLKVLQPYYKNQHETWMAYYHTAHAYVKKKDLTKAIYEVNKGLKNKDILQWVFVDHRAQKFLEYMCTLAKI